MKFLGTNWRTSLYGIVSGVCAFLAFYPGALEPLPDYWENLVRQIVAFVMGAGLIKMGTSSADVKVSKEISKESMRVSDDIQHQIDEIKNEKRKKD